MDVDAARLAQRVYPVMPVRRLEIQHGIRTERRQDLALPSGCPDRLVVLQRVARGIGCAQNLDIEALKEGTRTELGRCQPGLNLVIDALCRRAVELLVDAEYLPELLSQPNACQVSVIIRIDFIRKIGTPGRDRTCFSFPKLLYR